MSIQAIILMDLLEITCHFYPNQVAGVSNLWPVGCMQPRMATNVAHNKIVNLLKTLRFFVRDYVSQCI